MKTIMKMLDKEQNRTKYIDFKGGFYMLKKLSALTFMFLILIAPISVFAAAGGGGAEEAAHAEPTGLVMILLTILSFATLIYMVYLTVTDNG